SMVGLTWNARVVDRRLLSGLEWTVWDSVATALQGRLTDAVIDDATQRLPPELRQLNQAALSGALKHRRDQLPLAARRFYQLLAAEADVHAGDKADRVEGAHPSGPARDRAVYQR